MATSARLRRTRHFCESGRMSYEDTLRLFQDLQPGDLVELTHDVKVGFRNWQTSTRGEVVRTERRRHGLHRQRNPDDRVFSDMLVLRREDGELTTVTLDEFSRLKRLAD